MDILKVRMASSDDEVVGICELFEEKQDDVSDTETVTEEIENE